MSDDDPNCLNAKHDVHAQGQLARHKCLYLGTQAGRSLHSYFADSGALECISIDRFYDGCLMLPLYAAWSMHNGVCAAGVYQSLTPPTVDKQQHHRQSTTYWCLKENAATDTPPPA